MIVDSPIFTSIRLQNIRSYSDFAVELSPGVNIIVGPNASGKTNLLEALLVICGNSPYRASIGEIITHNKEWARIDVNTQKGSRVLKLIKRVILIERTYEINEKIKKRLSFTDKLPVILFEPEHMRLLTGSPQLRRDFLDDILIATKLEFNSLSQKYHRALMQRNHLLKNHHHSDKKQLFVWNVRLCELAGQIVEARVGLIEALNKKITTTYGDISQAALKITLEYNTTINHKTYESTLLHKLENNLENDLARGFTTHGPHREDLSVLLNKRPASLVASRGETRTLVVALKLLALEILEQSRGQKPLILLDDVFSELDGVRRKALTARLKGYQTIITTTDADIVGKNIASQATIIAL